MVCVCKFEVSMCVRIHNIVLEVWKMLSIHIKFYFIFTKNEREKVKAKMKVINLRNIKNGVDSVLKIYLFSSNNRDKLVWRKRLL